MKKFDGVLFLTDFDGTFGYRGKVSEKNEKAVEYFKQNGGLFTIATGRSYSDMPGYIKYCNTNYIGITGTAVLDPSNGNILYEDVMDSDAPDILTDIMAEYEDVLEGIIYFYDSYMGADRAELRGDPDALRKYAKDRKTYKMILSAEAPVLAAIKDPLNRKYGDRYRFDRSGPCDLDMHSATSGKGELIPHLIEHCGRTIHTVIAAGDYENDISMLKIADIGYAVGNALDNVKASADRVTVNCDQNAVAKIICELEKEL